VLTAVTTGGDETPWSIETGHSFRELLFALFIRKVEESEEAALDCIAAAPAR
jgi:hypothetical protein